MDNFKSTSPPDRAAEANILTTDDTFFSRFCFFLVPLWSSRRVAKICQTGSPSKRTPDFFPSAGPLFPVSAHVRPLSSFLLFLFPLLSLRRLLPGLYASLSKTA